MCLSSAQGWSSLKREAAYSYTTASPRGCTLLQDAQRQGKGQEVYTSTDCNKKWQKLLTRKAEEKDQPQKGTTVGHLHVGGGGSGCSVRVGCRRVRGWFSAFSLPSIYMHLPDLVKSSPESNYLLCKRRKLYRLRSWAPKNTCLLERCPEELNKNASYTQLVNKGALLYNEWFVLSKQEHCLNSGCCEMAFGGWGREKKPIYWKCLACTHHITYARHELGSGRLSWYSRVGWQEHGTL